MVLSPGAGRAGAAGVACLVCRLPTLPLVCFVAPIPPPALAERSSRREGGDQGYFMQGASPLASPRLNPRGTGSTCRCRRLNGGRAPGVAGSASVSGTRRGLAFFVARCPRLSLAFLPLSPRPRSQSDLPRWGRGRSRLFYARGFAPCIPGNRPGAALAMLAGNRFFGRCRGDTCFAAVKSASGQSIIEKSSWGFGGFFQEAPNVSPVPPVPPRCTPPHAGRNCKLHKNAQNG